MNNKEIYRGLRLLVRTYISEEKQAVLLTLLNEREIEGSFPPGKGILAYVNSDSNGVDLKDEHKGLWGDICYHCV